MSGIWSARDPGMPSELYWGTERVGAALVGVLNVVIGYAAYGLEGAGALLVLAIVCNLRIWRPDAFGYPATYGEKLAHPTPTFAAGTTIAHVVGWMVLLAPAAVFVVVRAYARFVGPG